jgi:hypothetical protein
MKLTNMAMSSKESKAMTNPEPVSPNPPIYPYGLQIDLSEESIQKLGIETLPVVGSVLMIHAKVTVSRTSENIEQDKKAHRNLALQITDLG